MQRVLDYNTHGARSLLRILTMWARPDRTDRLHESPDGRFLQAHIGNSDGTQNTAWAGWLFKLHRVGQTHAVLRAIPKERKPGECVLIGTFVGPHVQFCPAFFTPPAGRVTIAPLKKALQTYAHLRIGPEAFPVWRLPQKLHLNTPPWLDELTNMAIGAVFDFAPSLHLDLTTAHIRVRLHPPALRATLPKWERHSFDLENNGKPMGLSDAQRTAFTRAAIDVLSRHTWGAASCLCTEPKPFYPMSNQHYIPIRLGTLSMHQRIAHQIASAPVRAYLHAAA